ncbi:hypothetical protein C4D60_Mb06t07030 [Musa balbisiana]|uniref:UDP-3-O-acyl-N-acetylglucosamine deacetylase n=1 Tax=Musa balbisiana TaxID=52838 RepID=A0A4S8ILX8_MUSBA|nr:hypothetical protein C4D60_Mb06t07030 [Musa balbisiana]
MWPPQERDSKPTRTHHSLKLIILYAIAYPRGISKSPRSIILSRDIRRTQAVESGASNEAKGSGIAQNPSKPREKVKAALHSAAATSLPMTSPLLRHHRRRLLSTCTRALKCLSRSISWNPTGRPQQTLASSVSRSGTALHSGDFTTARLLPAAAGEGRFFVAGHSRPRTRIPAAIGHVVDSALCTTLSRDGTRVRTVEHLLSALEACGVDNCRIEIDGGDEVCFLLDPRGWWRSVRLSVGLVDGSDGTLRPDGHGARDVMVKKVEA